MVSTAGLVFSRHPEFISGSYQFEVLRSTCKMLKRVQHDGFVFNCRRGDLNPQGFLHTPLKRARIPIPPLRQIRY